MAKAQKKVARSSKGAFRGVTLVRSGTGGLTIKLSDFKGVDVTIIADGNVRIAKKPRVEEQTNDQGNDGDVIIASLDIKAYYVDDVLPDGWTVGPLSPTTGMPVKIEPVESALKGYQTWHKGQDRAKKMRGQGHARARQPDVDELNALYNGVVKAFRNDNTQFNTSGFYPYGLYWASRPLPMDPLSARVQYFRDGATRADCGDKDDPYALVRIIADLPHIILLNKKDEVIYAPQP